MDFILAFSAGLLSFLSPCVLPLIPLYLSHLVGTSVAEIDTRSAKLNLLLKSAFFVAGFSIIFILLGVSVSAVSKLFTDHLDLIRQIGGLLIIIFGLHMTGLFKIKLLYSEKRLFMHKTGSNSSYNNISSLLLGMAFAVGWTPCIGPILSSILIYAGSMDTIGKGVLLLVAYSIGFAVPIMLAALLVEHLTKALKKFTKYIPAVSVVSGIVMIGMGILVFSNRLEIFSQYGNWLNL